MTSYTITITDTQTNKIVETAKNVRIPDRMRIRRQYQGLEHDGRYTLTETKQRYDALGYPSD